MTPGLVLLVPATLREGFVLLPLLTLGGKFPFPELVAQPTNLARLERLSIGGFSMMFPPIEAFQVNASLSHC